jgi:hypothetical protein
MTADELLSLSERKADGGACLILGVLKEAWYWF